MKLTLSPHCMHCGKPHGKLLRWICESCDACDAKRDQQMIDVSEGLVTASCPRCDLLFAVDMKTTLTDEEREAIDDAAGICEEHAEEYDGTDNSPIAATLRKLLERLK